MPQRKRFFSFLCLFIPLLAVSCFNIKRPSEEIRYYTLEYDPPNKFESPSLPVILRVGPFSVAPEYDTNRIVFRDGAHRREAYSYYKWWVNPKELVGSFLERDIRRSGLFLGVLKTGCGTSPSFRIEGMVDEFFEYDSQKTWKAVMTLSILLMNERETRVDKQILFQKTYRQDNECEQKNPGSLAEAMSRNMKTISEQILTDVYQYLNKELVQPNRSTL